MTSMTTKKGRTNACVSRGGGGYSEDTSENGALESPTSPGTLSAPVFSHLSLPPMRLRTLLLTTALSAAALPAAAQTRPNWRAEPIFDTVNLEAGFTPDPTTRTVAAGGSDAFTQGTCSGFITNSAPDIDLNWTGAESTLTISAASATDIMLVIYTPDGRWLCDDDSAGNLNAKLTFRTAAAGNYNIWIGTASATDARPQAILGFSELGETVKE